jgi:hypothetical protein
MMAKGSLYPFRVRVSEPALINVYKVVHERRATKIMDKNISKKIGHDIKPIRKDILLGPDSKFKNGIFGLAPELDMELIPRGSAYDAVFKPMKL